MHCGSQTADGLGQTCRAQLPMRQEGHGALHPVTGTTSLDPEKVADSFLALAW